MTASIPTPLRHLLRRTRFWVLSVSATLMFGVALAAPSAALADSASWSVEPASASWSTTPNPSSTDPGTTPSANASTTPGVAPSSV